MLFLKAMCVVNTGSPQEAKNALEEVIAARPGKEILQVTSDILASLAVGEKPVRYSEAEMAQAVLYRRTAIGNSMKKYWLVVAGKKKQLIKSKKKKNNGWYCFYHRNLQPFRKPDLKRV